jgi:hypothetical protein
MLLKQQINSIVPLMQPLSPTLHKLKHIFLQKHSLEFLPPALMELYPHATAQNGSTSLTAAARSILDPAQLLTSSGFQKLTSVSALIWVTARKTLSGTTTTAAAFVIL